MVNERDRQKKKTARGVYSKKIAKGITDNSPDGENFVIMECPKILGMRNLIGPEKDKTKLRETLDNLTMIKIPLSFLYWGMVFELGIEEVPHKF